MAERIRAYQLTLLLEEGILPVDDIMIIAGDYSFMSSGPFNLIAENARDLTNATHYFLFGGLMDVVNFRAVLSERFQGIETYVAKLDLSIGKGSKGLFGVRELDFDERERALLGV